MACFENNKRRRDKLIAAGICCKCGKGPPSSGRKVCDVCREYEKRRSALRRQSALNKGLCYYCQKPTSGTVKCDSCSNESKRYMTERRERTRRLVMSHYGTSCSCCGEKEDLFLAIDHVNGGGSKHRKEIRREGSAFYDWLMCQGFPTGFRVLCHNCNWAEARGGCPHRKCRRNFIHPSYYGY